MDKINTGLVVEEPIKIINNQIDDKGKVVLLSGNRGTGKTTVLEQRRMDNIEKGVSTVLHRFDVQSISAIYEMDKSVVEHYFELKMTEALVKHSLYEGKLYGKNFRIYREFKDYSSKFVSEVLSYESGGRDFITCINLGKFTEPLIDGIKKSEGSKKIELLIDRFDWMENGYSLAQKSISNYFPLFDKVVITTDDISYKGDKDKVNVYYGYDVDTVHEIIGRLILSNDEIPNEWIDFLTEERLRELVEVCSGDISLMIKALLDVIEVSDIKEDSIGSLDDTLEHFVKKRIYNKMDIMNCAGKHKLYI